VTIPQIGDRSEQRLQAAAPAKVNLGLRIVGRRADGYHELESVFLPLDLADDVVVECRAARRGRVEISVETAPDRPAGEVPGDSRNLAARAAQGFLDRTGLGLEVKIRLTKRIPVAAGLGGGSSDAGTVLRLLAAAHPGVLDAGSLAGLALNLGADVPYFLDPIPAWIAGVGEIIDPLPICPELNLLLVNPGVPLSTADVYRATDLLHTAASPESPEAGSLRERMERVMRDLSCGFGSVVGNDLEAAAIRLCPPIAHLRRRLLAVGASAVGLSGSGPTIYGVFASAAAARGGLAGLAPDPSVWARIAVAGPGSRQRRNPDNL
jgi:4-diphosphocytidyl-2-C-methyl-D-erythritol kinase